MYGIMRALLLAPLLGLLFGLLPTPAATAGQGMPSSLAGITLGAPLGDYTAIARMDTIMRRTDAKFIYEVMLDEARMQGVRRAYIGFGDCTGEPAVIWIKIKFADDSMDLFDALMRRYVRAFGDPDAWEGDAFHVETAWRWDFQDADGRRVDLLLTHSKDPQTESGVVVKMTLGSLYEAEQRCWKLSRQEDDPEQAPPAVIGNTLDDYVPR